MYQAEIRGKVPQSIARSEDVLTSNVFSFFKYADRDIYLRRLMDLLGIPVTADGLKNAELSFWPHYGDGTEPDVVLVVGKYYLLFEAKYFSGVGAEDGNRAAQLIREIKMGRLEAGNLAKEFRLILVTSDTLCPECTLADIPQRDRRVVTWMKWQQVSELLLDARHQIDTRRVDDLFARDLYELLDRKHLRGFLSVFFARAHRVQQVDRVWN